MVAELVLQYLCVAGWLDLPTLVMSARDENKVVSVMVLSYPTLRCGVLRLPAPELEPEE
jgi:hypothetical protein